MSTMRLPAKKFVAALLICSNLAFAAHADPQIGPSDEASTATESVWQQTRLDGSDGTFGFASVDEAAVARDAGLDQGSVGTPGFSDIGLRYSMTSRHGALDYSAADRSAFTLGSEGAYGAERAGGYDDSGSKFWKYVGVYIVIAVIVLALSGGGSSGGGGY